MTTEIADPTTPPPPLAPGRPETSGTDADPLAEFSALTEILSRELTGRWCDSAGLLGDMCRYAMEPSGKLFRPLLLLESARAVGGRMEDVLPAAVGAESGHVASLVHDDIIDEDDTRRGRASVPYKYGLKDAIVAGDALLFDLFAGLAECRKNVPDDRVVSALAAVASAGLDLCHGQTLEATITRERRVDVDAYIEVARLKTAAYFRGVCECGSLLGGGSPDEVSALSEYGESLGLAFQIRDDLLGYVSDPELTGKPASSDIENHRVTLPIIFAYRAVDPAGRAVLDAAIGTVDREAAPSHDAVCHILERTGALEAASLTARQFALRAHRSLSHLRPSASRSRFEKVADVVAQRRC